jgi:hypothetical protein
MRPNLMSPRRAASSGEASILAMLEREPAHKRGKGASGARLAWYGASAALALALTGALVWLVANNDGLGRDVPDSVLADAGKAAQRDTANDSASSVLVAAPPPGAGAALIQVAMAPPTPAPAVIVDQRPTPEGVPPLRLLKPPPAAKPSAKSAVTVLPAPRPAAPVEARAPARPAVASAAAAKPKPVLVAKGATRPTPPKAQRGAAPAKPDAAVDADVALISAVIVHANGHAPEGSQMTELLCPNGACQSRPASQ